MVLAYLGEKAASLEIDDWMDYRSTCEELGQKLVPPSQAIRKAELQRSYNYRAQGVAIRPRTQNMDVANQVAVGQSTVIRIKISNLERTGYLEVKRDEKGPTALRLTSKGWAGIAGDPAKKQEPRSPVHTHKEIYYRLDFDFNMKPNIVAVGADSTVAIENKKAIQSVLDKAFPGRVVVTLVEEILPDDAA